MNSATVFIEKTDTHGITPFGTIHEIKYDGTTIEIGKIRGNGGGFTVSLKKDLALRCGYVVTEFNVKNMDELLSSIKPAYLDKK